MSKKKLKGPKRPSASKPTPSSKASTPSTVNRSKWIPIEKSFPLPLYVREVVTRLDQAGFSAYLVGGAVRDFLLGLPVKDYDLVTDATPEEIEELYPNAVDVGRAFGVMRVPLSDGGQTQVVEVATFREDSEYTDFRHPKSVRFSGPEEDARRRDFTINGLFYDPKTRRVLDCVEGMEDLRQKKLRAIGDPNERLKEDALRVLRAVRFAVRFDFQIEENTWKALLENARFTRKISAERVREEISSMLRGRRPDQSIRILKELGVVSLWIPELLKVKTEVFTFLDHDPRPRSAALVFAASFSEAGGEDPTKSLQSACDRLRLSGDDKKRVTELVLHLPRFADAFRMREATLRRWVGEPFFDELLQLYLAWAKAQGGNLLPHHFLEQLRKEHLQGPLEEKWVTGADLVTLGFTPGPQFADILRVVEDLQFEKKLRSKDEALEYVVKHFVR